MQYFSFPRDKFGPKIDQKCKSWSFSNFQETSNFPTIAQTLFFLAKSTTYDENRTIFGGEIRKKHSQNGPGMDAELVHKIIERNGCK